MTGADVERFVRAQDDSGTFAQALAELRAGRKTSHWMWFIFPQLQGLGRSPSARLYALSGLEEARAYVAHRLLGPRLRQCCEAILAVDGSSAEQIFGAVDSTKLRSSMTLFARAEPHESLFNDVLEKFFDGKPDSLTDELLS